MRRIISAVIIAVLLGNEGFAEVRFSVFPTLGVCKGSSVRYRAEPNTKAAIRGHLGLNEKVIINEEILIDGELWYGILTLDRSDSAYVYGKYLAPCFDEEAQRSPVNRMIIDVLQLYSKHNDFHDVKRTRNKQGRLIRVEALKRGSKFGNIAIGDNLKKLTETLGEPDRESVSEWKYTAGSSVITFRITGDQITRMIYEE